MRIDRQGGGGSPAGWNGRIRRFGEAILDLLLPRSCAGCQSVWLSTAEGLWCESCLRELPWISSPICPTCGTPYPSSPSAPDHLCGECALSGMPFDTARSAVEHEGVVRDRIHQFKFGGRLHWVPALVALLDRTFHSECPGRVDMIIPVPLHVRRLKERGYNQSALLAGRLARRLGFPARFDVLERIRWTDPQTRLNREDRQKNVKGSFRVNTPNAVKGKRILLVDDVFTTGTTLMECSKALKNGGAGEVHALTVTRAVRR